MNWKKTLRLALILSLTVFFVHRFTMDLHFFSVTERFERPQPVKIPKGLTGISAKDCGTCHEEIYNEWKTTIHSQAWTDPYFQVDFKYDRYPQICLNCHTPLENQQENLVTGFSDEAKFRPILEPNPNFDPELRDEGVTCAVCHIKDGVIVGSYDIETTAHPVRKYERFLDGRGICQRCHMVPSVNRWDYFLKLPPCGNFAEIEAGGKKADCVKCHMPEVERPLVEDGPVRKTGRHFWRGGHDPKMVKKAAEITLAENSSANKKTFTLHIKNAGTEHRFPTGTPDRHLRILFRLLDEKGNVIKEKKRFIERTILWRPFIADIYDNRIRYLETASYSFSLKAGEGAFLEAEVRYGLLRESRRRRIGYENSEPIHYRIFYKKVPL